MPDTIVRGTARRLGIVRPLPTRQITPAELQERAAHGLSQMLIGASMFLRTPQQLAENPASMLIDGQFFRRVCGTCRHTEEHHRWVVTPESHHYCRRDDAVAIVSWPGDRHA